MLDRFNVSELDAARTAGNQRHFAGDRKQIFHLIVPLVDRVLDPLRIGAVVITAVDIAFGYGF